MTNFLRRCFAVDIKALAVFRVALAIQLLCDLAVRATFLDRHYTDQGVLPVDLLSRIDWHPFEKVFGVYHLSLHAISGEACWQVVLFSLSATVAVGLMLGWKTRWMTFLSWILLTSLQVRNPLIIYGGDHLLRLLLFWGMFLPLGSAWSMDSLGHANRGRCHVSMASAALILQVLMVYWFTALLKSSPAWHDDGSALIQALQLDLYAKPFADVMLRYPEHLSMLTHMVWWFELLGPVFLLFAGPWRSLRLLVILCFCLLQLAFGLCLELGIFPWVSVIALIPFFPVRAEEVIRVNGGSSILVKTVPALCLLYVLFWNIDGMGVKGSCLNNAARWPGQVLRLDQYWTMFAPEPLKDDGWFVVECRTSTGSDLDLLRDEVLTWDKPHSVSSTFRNHRERKYFINLRSDYEGEFLASAAKMYCHDARNRGIAAEGVEIVYCLETSGEPELVSMAEARCGANSQKTENN